MPPMTINEAVATLKAYRERIAAGLVVMGTSAETDEMCQTVGKCYPVIVEAYLKQLESNATRKPLVYIAGPYTKPDPVVNTREAILLGQRIREQLGVQVFVPHFSHFEHLLSPRDFEYWMAIDLEWIERCDVLFRMAGESAGADREVIHARKLGIPVITDSIGDLADLLALQWMDAQSIVVEPAVG